MTLEFFYHFRPKYFQLYVEPTRNLPSSISTTRPHHRTTSFNLKPFSSWSPSPYSKTWNNSISSSLLFISKQSPLWTSAPTINILAKTIQLWRNARNCAKLYLYLLKILLALFLRWLAMNFPKSIDWECLWGISEWMFMGRIFLSRV